MKLLLYVFLIIVSACIIMLSGVILKIYRVQQPFQADDVPEWTVMELNPHKWELRSITDPERSTIAWVISPAGLQCDTLILVGGVEEGENLLAGGGKWKYTGNTILMKQPVHSFLLRHHWKNWSWLDWWHMPEKIREETRHTLGALNALLSYVHGGMRSDPRFTDKVVMAGGSVGSAFPVILTSFAPEKVAGLMVIYGFTNFQYVIQSKLFTQGLIHLGLTKSSDDLSTKIKISGIRLTSHILSFFLGNILKYAQIEHYLPAIYDTPIHFINGTNDPLAPPEAYLPMWESSPEPKSEKWVEGGHFNPGAPEDLLLIGKLMYEWSAAHGVRSCHSPNK